MSKRFKRDSSRGNIFPVRKNYIVSKKSSALHLRVESPKIRSFGRMEVETFGSGSYTPQRARWHFL